MKAQPSRIERLRQDIAMKRSLGPMVVLLDPSPDPPTGLHRIGPPGSQVAIWAGDPAGLSDQVPPHALILGGEIDPHAFTPFRGVPA